MAGDESGRSCSRREGEICQFTRFRSGVARRRCIVVSARTGFTQRREIFMAPDGTERCEDSWLYLACASFEAALSGRLKSPSPAELSGRVGDISQEAWIRLQGGDVGLKIAQRLSAGQSPTKPSEVPQGRKNIFAFGRLSIVPPGLNMFSGAVTQPSMAGLFSKAWA